MMKRVPAFAGRWLLIGTFGSLLSGCCYISSRTDLTTMREVQETGLIGSTLILKDSEFLLRERYVDYDELCGQYPPEYLNHWHEYISGKLEAGTKLRVEEAVRDECVDYIFGFPQEAVLARVTSGPNRGRTVDIGSPELLRRDGINLRIFEVHRETTHRSPLLP